MLELVAIDSLFVINFLVNHTPHYYKHSFLPHYQKTGYLRPHWVILFCAELATKISVTRVVMGLLLVF
ncbi:hypothetical protein Hdeb2414_s0012g00379961 [Helianthus debilis subsp. tardiflorus]